ncbi:DUF58 domain-containing protein [Paenibacillus glucanolyticus]|uniref:DUF58 domain-containing protein n=1 Tax=Paenibacillus glucanolyticus TaxID=59843 RepID=UPI00128E5B5B|nr:DUF58 domain-containing protein [Paenibacillus glucanolyticus]MPY15270.1 DUF58 domain-containing protein [Paenibacillus glucanolyticus]
MRRGLLEWSRGIAIWFAALGLYLWLGGESLRFVWLACTFLLLCGGLTSLFGPTRMTISRRSSPACIQAGDSVEMTIQITYRSVLPLPWLIVTDRMGSREYRKLLFPGMRKRLEYTYRLNQVPRGVWSSIYSKVEWGDMFGWFRTCRSLQSDTGGFIVLPRPMKWPEAQVLVQGSDMDREDERARVRVWNETRGTGVRDYIPGDPMNRIHWKNSAKLGRLQSFMPHEGYGVRQGIVLDTALQGYFGYEGVKPEDAFEETVSVAVGLVTQLLRDRMPFKLRMDGAGVANQPIEYKGASSEHHQDILLPFASVQLAEKDSVRSPRFEFSHNSSEKNTEWAVMTGVFHKNAAVTGINLLNEGSRKVTIYCTQMAKRMKSPVNASPVQWGDQDHPEWAHEFFSKGGKLVYLQELSAYENSTRIGGAGYDRIQQQLVR